MSPNKDKWLIVSHSTDVLRGFLHLCHVRVAIRRILVHSCVWRIAVVRWILSGSSDCPPPLLLMEVKSLSEPSADLWYMWSVHQHLIITSVRHAAHSLNHSFRAFKHHLWSLLVLKLWEERNAETPNSLEHRWFAAIQKRARLGNKWDDLAHKRHTGSREEARAPLKWQNIKIIKSDLVSQQADRSLLILVLSCVFNVQHSASWTCSATRSGEAYFTLIQDWMCLWN